MSENCSGSCSSCSSDCESRKGPQILRNANNGKVKKVIAVVSGKGGVGKSLVTSMLAVKANKEGKKVYTTDIFVEEQEFAESKSSGGNTGCRYYRTIYS